MSDDKLYSTVRFNQNPDYYNEYLLLAIIYYTVPCVILVSRYAKHCESKTEYKVSGMSEEDYMHQ